MGLAQGLSLEEAVKPLMALRYLSCDVEGTMINFENAIANGFAVWRPRLGNSPSPIIALAH